MHALASTTTSGMCGVDGDPVKLARMLEIQSWFDNKDQLVATATSMAKYLQ